MGAVSLVETVEYMVLCLLIHAASIVQNLENHLVFLPVQLQFYLSVLRGKFDGVVNQVNPYLVRSALFPRYSSSSISINSS